MIFTRGYERLLLDLIRIPTPSPLESGGAGDIRAAQRRYAEAAAEAGFEVIHHAPAEPEALRDPRVPQPVLEAERGIGPGFLASQPNLVLRAGAARARERTLAFNFHMDTVAGGPEPAVDGGRVRGRGAIDAKGPGVALLAGVGAALARRPSLRDEITVLIQCVAGEEGGAMGVYGSRVLADLGHLGRLNVFAEPTGGVWFDRATAAMTARVTVDGDGAIDDAPEDGHNASVLLGYAAAALAEELDPAVRALGARACIAGLHTGTMHNRVYGTGELLVNFAYPSADVGERIERMAGDWLARTKRRFGERYAGLPAGARAARDVERILALTWLKRGLPALDNRDPEMEAVLLRAGLRRLPDARAAEAFTCDAIWAQAPGSYTVVYGPGDLAADGAHTDSESASIEELDAYAAEVADVVLAFGDAVA